MREILDAFGVDWRLIVIQIFNFTLLLTALWYFLYTPILKILKERQGVVEKGVRDAEEAEKKLLNAHSEKDDILRKAHTEGEEVALRAKKYAEGEASEIVESAHGKSEKFVEEAKKQAELIKQEARRESQAEIAKVAILAAEKVLRKNN